MLDELPKKPKFNESAIINLDTSDGPGTHWVCYVKKGKRVIYFDPMGNLRPPPALRSYFIGSRVLYNRERYQKWNTPYCGHLCLRFLVYNSD